MYAPNNKVSKYMRQKVIELQGEILHLTAAAYTSFSSSHAKFTKIDHILGHKAQLKKIQKKRNYTKYVVISQCNYTKNQKQREG